MRSAVVTALAALLSVGLFAPPDASASIIAPYTSRGRTPVAPGVDHDWGEASATSGEQKINFLEIAPGAPGIGFEVGLPDGRVNSLAATTAQAFANSSEGHRVIGAINGDIYTVAAPGQAAALGLTIRHGELVTSGEPRPAFGVDASGTPLIGIPRVTMTLALPDGSSAPINRLNQRRLIDQIVLYTPRFDSHTTTDASGTEVVLTGAPSQLSPTGTYTLNVAEVRSGLGDSAIADGQWVLSGAGLGAATLGALTLGDQLDITVSIDIAWAGVVNAIGGPELLVQDGTVDIEPIREKRITGAAPRTALGLRTDGTVILVTVDGRSPFSGGLTLHDMAELMRSLGADQALNLDGGGSTTMAVRRLGDVEVSVANRLSSGFERAVNTTLHLVSSTPTGSTAHLLVDPRESIMPIGGFRQFVAKGYDEALNGTVVDPGQVSWSTTGDAARVDAAGVVEGLEPGEATVHAGLGDLEASAQVAVSSDAYPPTASAPEVAMRATGAAGSGSITVDVGWSALDGEGPLAQLELEQSINGGSWTSIALANPGIRAISRDFKFQRGYQFRLRATDGAGNQTEWLESAVYRVVPYNELAPEVALVGPWSVLDSTSAIARRFGRNDVRSAPGSTASLSFIGRQVAWIGIGGPGRGLAQVVLDDVAVADVNAYRPTKKPRRILYASSSALEAGVPHVIEVHNVSRASRPYVDLDAFLVLAVE